MTDAEAYRIIQGAKNNWSWMWPADERNGNKNLRWNQQELRRLIEAADHVACMTRAIKNEVRE